MKQKLTTLFKEFIKSEQSSGIVLILCMVAALVLANSPLGESFLNFWHLKIGFDLGGLHLKYDLEHWINDGLMAIFVTFLAFGNTEIAQSSKLAVLLGSMLAGSIGYLILKVSQAKHATYPSGN